MSLATAVSWMARLTGLAAAIAAIELLVARRALADAGVFSWPLLRRELTGAPRPVRWLADRAFAYPGTIAILAIQLAAALALPWVDHAAPAWLVVAATLAIAIRFRGSYNGGSDAMLLIAALAVALARTAPGSPLARAGLAYAAAQLVLSYFVAGVAKLGDPAWRRGTALGRVGALPHYHVPPGARALLARPGVSRLAGWAMLVFELGFPLALAGPTACAIGLAVGAAFHLANACLLGLNRFLWAWLAAYPALIFVAMPA